MTFLPDVSPDVIAQAAAAMHPRLEFGRGLLADASHDWGHYLLLTMPAPWDIAQPTTSEPPHHVHFVDSMENLDVHADESPWPPEQLEQIFPRSEPTHSADGPPSPVRRGLRRTLRVPTLPGWIRRVGLPAATLSRFGGRVYLWIRHLLLPMGCLYPAAFSMLADVFSPRQRGKAMGTISAIGMSGIVIGAFAFGEMLNVPDAGWRWAFISLGLASILSGLVIAVLVHDPVRGAAEPELEAVITEETAAASLCSSGTAR